MYVGVELGKKNKIQSSLILKKEKIPKRKKVGKFGFFEKVGKFEFSFKCLGVHESCEWCMSRV